MSSWTNVPGTATVDFSWEDMFDEEAENPVELQLLLLEAVLKKYGDVKIDPEKEFSDAQLEIEFTSTGYCDPGKLSGPPEDCYPPEGDDERSLVTIELSTTSYSVIIEGDLADKLFAKYASDVDDVEIDESNDDGGYDPDDDIRWDDDCSDAAADAYERAYYG
jgi:hypothetical protein